MRRSFERKSKLRRFRCDLGALENFINEVSAEFPSDNPSISISISRRGEDLSFESIQEMRDYDFLPASITNLSISISDYSEEQPFRFYLSSGMMNLPYVRGEGPSEAWCAGVVEKTKSFARSSQAWYWFIRGWVFWCLGTAVAAFLPTLVINREKSGTSITTIITLLIFGFICMYLFFCYEQVFRPIVIILRQEEGWTKKHATELTVAAAIVSALAALYTALK